MAMEPETAQEKARRAAEEAARREEAAAGGADDEEAKKRAADKEFNDRLNDFYTKREKRTLSQFEKMLDGKLSALLGQRNDPSASARNDEEEEEEEEPAPAPAAGAPATPAPAAAAPSKQDAATKKALKRLQEAEKRLAERERALAEEAEKGKTAELRSETLRALTEAECSNVKGAFALLKEDGRIGRDKEGRLVFLTPEGDFVDEEPLEDGVKKWLASDEGKEYAKPRGVGGSGSSDQGKGASAQGGAPRRSTKNLSKTERMAKAGETLMSFARGGLRG